MTYTGWECHAFSGLLSVCGNTIIGVSSGSTIDGVYV